MSAERAKQPVISPFSIGSSTVIAVKPQAISGRNPAVFAVLAPQRDSGVPYADPRMRTPRTTPSTASGRSPVAAGHRRARRSGRVAAGAIAKKLLKQLGNTEARRQLSDYSVVQGFVCENFKRPLDSQ